MCDLPPGYTERERAADDRNFTQASRAANRLADQMRSLARSMNHEPYRDGLMELADRMDEACEALAVAAEGARTAPLPDAAPTRPPGVVLAFPLLRAARLVTLPRRRA